MLKNIKDSLETAYKQGLESDDNIYIKGQIKDWEEILSNIKHEQELKDNALKMYDEGQEEIERLNNIIDKLEIDIEIGTGKYTYDTDYNRGLCDAFIYMNDRLKELKGSE